MTKFTVLVVGATGSIGRHAVAECLRRGHRTRALVRDASRGASLPADSEIVLGDLTNAATLTDAIDGVDGIVFTQQLLLMLQGDRRWASDPSDGVVSRAQIAQVLLASVSSEAANHKSFELVAEYGPAQADLDPLFDALRPDPTDALDAVLDQENMPIDQEPRAVIADLDSAKRRTPQPPG